jgi:RNA polymerase-binding transcription factor DksA
VGDLQPELEEHAQTEVTSGITEALGERQQVRLGNIDEVLARIEAGTYGDCQSCGRPIGRERLEANPTTTFCGDCASEEEADAAGQAEESAEEDPPASGPVPPDLGIPIARGYRRTWSYDQFSHFRIPSLRQARAVSMANQTAGGDFPPKLWITLWII